MVNAHTSAEAQLSWQGLVYSLMCEIKKRPINNTPLKHLLRFITGLTEVLSKESNCSSKLQDDPDAANTEGEVLIF